MQNHNIDITDLNQPLLVTREKKTRGPGGKVIPQTNIFLVPELCTLTGIILRVYVIFFIVIFITHINRLPSPCFMKIVKKNLHYKEVQKEYVSSRFQNIANFH